MTIALQIGNWYAKECPQGGYYIHKPGCGDTLVCWTKTVELAAEEIEERSGIAYARLPGVSISDLRIEKGEKRRTGKFGDWCQIEQVYYGEKYLGSIRVRRSSGRTETTTGVDGKCVLGYDLRWMLKEHGLRLERSE